MVELLPPCPTEDSTNCFWDATVNGNGMGQSFFEYDGITVLIEVPDGYHVESVQVEPDHFFEVGYVGPGYGVTLRENEPDATPTQTPETSAKPTTTATAEPTDTGAGQLGDAGLNFAPLGLVVAAALAVSLIGLSLIAWHQYRTSKKEN